MLAAAPRTACPERIVEINPFLRIPLRELGYGIILTTQTGRLEHRRPTFRYLHVMRSTGMKPCPKED
nr:hypothetical protein SHINE37_43067 [Rhizobiaceae bacterium]